LDGVGWRVMEVRGIEREFDEEEGNDSNDREKNRMGIVLESKQEGSSSWMRSILTREHFKSKFSLIEVSVIV
jgi:hypothetical protein